MHPQSNAQTPSITDLAWAAGFIDGEGCIRLARYLQRRSRNQKAGPGYHICLLAVNRNIDALRLLQSMFGGTIRKKVVAKGYNQTWQWECWSSTAYNAMRLLRPFFVIKHPHADLVFEFQERAVRKINLGRVPLTETEVSLRDSYWRKLKTLNGRGARIP
mgnify:CR=1 FL=1